MVWLAYLTPVNNTGPSPRSPHRFTRAPPRSELPLGNSGIGISELRNRNFGIRTSESGIRNPELGARSSMLEARCSMLEPPPPTTPSVLPAGHLGACPAGDPPLPSCPLAPFRNRLARLGWPSGQCLLSPQIGTRPPHLGSCNTAPRTPLTSPPCSFREHCTGTLRYRSLKTSTR